MKLVMDEKLKHRLIGLAVIVSLGAIFAPAIMKKSSQRNESNFSVNVKLPPKPVIPKVTMIDENDTFKTIKVQRVNVPSVADNNQLPEPVKAETIKSEQVIGARETKEVLATNSKPDPKKDPVKFTIAEFAKASADKTVDVAANTKKETAPSALVKPKAIVAQANKPAVVKKPIVAAKAVTPKVVAKAVPKAVISKEIYAVQLASFSQVSNAQALVNRLHGKGYKANYIKTTGRNGPIYKVFAGHSANKNDAVKMKSQLANAMQLNGFVVNTRIS